MAQPHPAAVTPRGELQPSEGVDRHRVGLDAAHVAQHEVGAPRLEQHADAVAETGQVCTRDRTANGKAELPHWNGHRTQDGRRAENSSTPDR
jgi:hypothetical protein